MSISLLLLLLLLILYLLLVSLFDVLNHLLYTPDVDVMYLTLVLEL